MAHNLINGTDGYLAAVRETEGTSAHLVKIRQPSAWTNKVMLVTPSDAKWAACMSTGIESYPTMLGTSDVYNDTQNLINAVGTCMNGLSWRDGYHPCINAFIRGSMRGPYSHRSGVTTSTERAEYVHSAVAYKFNLRRLHVSRMTQWSAYLRVYVPSLAHQWNNGEAGLYYCVLENVALMNGASRLCCRVESELPSLAADVAGGRDEWEFNGVANNVDSPPSGTYQTYYCHSVCYNPYHGDDCVSMPVWTANQRSSNGVPAANPTIYSHDFLISNKNNTDVIAANPKSVWAVVHFKRVNGFSHKTDSAGLLPDKSCCAWMYRADLVLKCTSRSF